MQQFHLNDVEFTLLTGNFGKLEFCVTEVELTMHLLQ